MISGRQVLLVLLWSAPSLLENKAVLTVCSGEICFLSDSARFGCQIKHGASYPFPHGSKQLT